MEEVKAGGLTRREVIQRGAALGAALAVAGPVVQGLGRATAFAQVSPPPTSEQPSLPSHFQLVVTFGDNSTRYGVKWDQQWEGLGQQGNVCWQQGDAAFPFEPATSEQLAYFSTATVTATSRGYEVTLPSAVEVIDAATYDGSNCFASGATEGPYWLSNTLVFPKPSTGQGGGGV